MTETERTKALQALAEQAQALEAALHVAASLGLTQQECADALEMNRRTVGEISTKWKVWLSR